MLLFTTDVYTQIFIYFRTSCSQLHQHQVSFYVLGNTSRGTLSLPRVTGANTASHIFTLYPTHTVSEE